MSEIFEVYVNGSVKFEGSRRDCELFAECRRRLSPEAEIQITEADEE
jgi:hypothetical protein